MPKYTTKEKEAIGSRLADVFQMAAVRDGGKLHKEPRYMLGQGYHTKTALGLFEVFVDIADQIDKGNYKGVEG